MTHGTVVASPCPNIPSEDQNQTKRQRAKRRLRQCSTRVLPLPTGILELGQVFRSETHGGLLTHFVVLTAWRCVLFLGDATFPWQCAQPLRNARQINHVVIRSSPCWVSRSLPS